MKKYRKFGPNDKVFAKVRGYPPWPARVVGVADESSNVSRMKYHIYFYGTGETAVVKAEDVFSYIENKNGKLGKPRKLKGFNEALEQIENEMTPDEKTQVENLPPTDPIDTSILSEDGATPNRRLSVADKEVKPNSSSVTPQQPVEEKKEELLEDSVSASSNAADAKTPKARKRKSEMTEPYTDSKKAKLISSPSHSPLPEVSPTKPSPDVTSRSGRKIKPKKYSDFDEISEFETSKAKSAQKSEQTRIIKAEDKTSEDELTFSHNGETVTILLGMNRPNFKNHKSSSDWDKLVLNQAEAIKDKVISGEMRVDQITKCMNDFTKEKSAEKKKEYEEDDQTYAILHVESQVLLLDLKIKSALSLAKADPEECLKCMEEFLTLPITALMLKKNPEVVETFKRLRKYVGNTNTWSMTEEKLRVFNTQAENIRNKADHIFNKMKGLFTVPEGKSFWSVFTTQLIDFNKATKKLSQADFYAITKDPVQT